jgi:hypothetical protein
MYRYLAIPVGSGKGELLELAVTLRLGRKAARLGKFESRHGRSIDQQLPGGPSALKPFGAVEIFIPHNDTPGWDWCQFLWEMGSSGAHP